MFIVPLSMFTSWSSSQQTYIQKINKYHMSSKWDHYIARYLVFAVFSIIAPLRAFPPYKSSRQLSFSVGYFHFLLSKEKH